MKITKRLLPLMAVAISFGIHSEISAAGVLYPDASLNSNLESDTYFFAGSHSAGVTFLDTFHFTLADGGSVTAAINDTTIEQESINQVIPNLMNNDYLTLSLFDGGGNFIAATGDGGVLSANGLLSGMTYTLTISGEANGTFGGVYDGYLAVEEVPLPAALPAFLSALFVLGFRSRKNSAEKPAVV